MIGNCPTTILKTGNTLQLVANVAPADADDKSVTWSSSNSEVATVDENGLVSALAQGSVKIMVTANNGGFTGNCNIGVMGTTTNVVNFDFNDDVKIYPNPVSDKLHIEFSKMDMNRIIIIFDSSGRMIYKESAGEKYKQIDTKSLKKSGMVSILIKSDQHFSAHKVCTF